MRQNCKAEDSSYLEMIGEHPVRNIVYIMIMRPFKAILSLAAYVIRFNDLIAVKIRTRENEIEKTSSWRSLCALR